MMLRSGAIVWIGAALMSCSAPPAAGSAAGPLRALIVTGHDGPWHDWKKSTPALQEVLEADPRIRVDILDDPRRLESADLAAFDVVILHFSAGELGDRSWKDPGEEARNRLWKYVEGGGGLFILHFACFAFRDWPAYADLAGRVWDRANSHDPRGRFEVRIPAGDHPLCRGLNPFEADDELYTCLVGGRPVEVLATARSRVTGKDHPMAFVQPFGKGRVFHTPLGHDAKAIRTAGTAELIRRGCAWAAGRDFAPPPR